jgi:hypothetical protein
MKTHRWRSISLTSALDGGGWSTPRPGRFTPGKDPVPLVQDAERTPESVWTGVENLAFETQTDQSFASHYTDYASPDQK